MSNQIIAPQKYKIFTEKLTNWGRKNIRNFPWRNDPNVYKCMIAEYFLQRTKAEQVIIPFSEFLKDFPCIEDIPNENADFSKYFDSLGLFQRSIYLEKAVKLIKKSSVPLEQYSVEDLMTLPGIGRYSAHAVLCFGKNLKLPIVDSNVIRIFRRVFSLGLDKKNHKNDPEFWELSENLLPDKDYKLFNYSMIDFGALTCKSKNPLCEKCIINEICNLYITENRFDKY